MENPIFRKNLNKIMIDKDINQNQIADFIGISRQAVNAWIRKGTQPTGIRFTKLCEFLGVTENELLYEVGGYNNQQDGKILVDKQEWEAREQELKYLRNIFKLTSENERLKNNQNVLTEA